MEVYTTTFTLRNADVDQYRRLRPSVLLTAMQEAAIRHTTLLGAGREKTLDRGLLWVVALQRAEIARWPEYDETVTLKTWPGKSMHLFFPRYYTLQDEQGSVLVRASALWALMDRQSRSMIFPEEAGVEIPGAELAEACALPRAVKPISATDETRFTVPYSYADLNGHMNNTRYLDLAQDVLPAALRQRPITRLEIEHSAEARVDQTLTLRFGGEGDDWFVQGEGEKRIFRLRLRYG